MPPTICYTLNADDFHTLTRAIAWLRTHHARKRLLDDQWSYTYYLYFQSACGTLALFLLYYQFVEHLQFRHKGYLILYDGITLGLIVILFWKPIWQFRVRQYCKKKGHSSSPLTVNLNHEGVQTQECGNSDFVPWAQIIFVADGESHLFLWENLESVLIVPKRAFDSPQDADNFLAFIENHRVIASMPPIAEPN